MLMPATIHPSSRTLLACVDGELPLDERQEVMAHVHNCAACRSELDGMETDLDWFLVLEAASRPVETPPPAEGLSRLLSATRQWRNAHPETAHVGAADGREVEQRVAGAMELFFGPAIAGAVQRQAGPADNAESLLAAFLGRRAASVLMSGVRRGEIQRSWAPDMS